MRSLTFSVLKNFKYKTTCFNCAHISSAGMLQPKIILTKIEADPKLVHIAPTWPEDLEPELRQRVVKDMQVFPNFITEHEEATLITELEPKLKRMRYEFDHWDNAIHGFRETERSTWSESNEAVMARVRAHVFAPPLEPLPHAHVLDLAAAGHIKPHIDAVRYCGEVIAGLCLLSSAVMHIQHETSKQLQLHALLQRRALYVMRGDARYKFTHAVLGRDCSSFRSEPVPRLRRVAVILRSRPLREHASDDTDAKLHTALED